MLCRESSGSAPNSRRHRFRSSSLVFTFACAVVRVVSKLLSLPHTATILSYAMLGSLRASYAYDLLEWLLLTGTGVSSRGHQKNRVT